MFWPRIIAQAPWPHLLPVGVHQLREHKNLAVPVRLMETGAWEKKCKYLFNYNGGGKKKNWEK